MFTDLTTFQLALW